MPPSKSNPRIKLRPVGRGGQRFGQSAAKASGLSDAIASFARSDVGKALLGDSSTKQRTLKGKSYELIPMETGVSGLVGAAARTASRSAAASGARSGGKIAASVSADASKAAARRTRQEATAIAKGTAKSRTKEGAEALERAEARAASRKSVMDAPKSSVKARSGKETGELSNKVTDKALTKFGEGRSSSLKSESGKGGRTAAQKKRVKADLEESLRRGRRLREEGKKDSGDYGTPPELPPTSASKPGVAPKAERRDLLIEARALANTKPKNPGRKATANQKAAYEKKLGEWQKRQDATKDKERYIAEGRVKPDGSLRPAKPEPLTPAEAKSIARNQRKLTKSKAKREDAPAVKKPSAKKKEEVKYVRADDEPGSSASQAAASAKDSASKTRKAFIDAGYPTSTADNMAAKASAQYTRGLNRMSLEPNKPFSAPKAKVNPSTPAAKPADRVPASTPGKELVRVPSTQGRKGGGPSVATDNKIPIGKPTSTSKEIVVRSGNVLDRNGKVIAPSGRGKLFNKKQKAVIGAAAVAGGAAAFQKKLDRDQPKDNPATATETNPVSDKSASETVRDKFGRKISRAEFDRRAAFRKANNLDSLSPAERAKWRKENKDKWQAEEDRRGKYRKNLGRKSFGKEAVTKTRNVKKRKSFDADAKKSLKG